MLHGILLALGIASCNPYAGDLCALREWPEGGSVDEIRQTSEGYDLPMPVLLVDPFEGDIQQAVNENPYVMVESSLPISVTYPLTVPAGHRLEGVPMITIVLDERINVPAHSDTLLLGGGAGGDISNVTVMGSIAFKDGIIFNNAVPGGSNFLSIRP